MSAVDAAMHVVHLAFAALWTGSVLFVTYAVVPLARDGDLRPGPLGAVVSKLTTVSRASALLLLITGGHLAGAGYTLGSLTGTPRGQLVLAMVLLWLNLAALVEVGAARFRDGLAEGKVRTPAREARTFFVTASVVAAALLAVAGLLAGGLAAP